MQRLIAIEWLKYRKYKTFWVLAGLFVLLLPLWNYEISNGLIQLGGGGKNELNFLSTAYSFPNVWGNVGFWASMFIWFISILMIIITTNEYTFRTHRQNVIDGLSRMQFYHAKVLMVLLLSVASTVYYFILGALFGYFNSGSFIGLFNEIEQVFYFFVLSVDYLGFALIIALFIKRSGLAIGLFLLYAMIVENILKGVINHYADKPYGNFLPLQASDELLPFPVTHMISALMPGNTISMTSYLLVALCWCAVYYMGGRMLLRRNDW
jgi:ABC-2 type transport system permease protein